MWFLNLKSNGSKRNKRLQEEMFWDYNCLRRCNTDSTSSRPPLAFIIPVAAQHYSLLLR